MESKESILNKNQWTKSS